jgi:hypothetical protein
VGETFASRPPASFSSTPGTARMGRRTTCGFLVVTSPRASCEVRQCADASGHTLGGNSGLCFGEPDWSIFLGNQRWCTRRGALDGSWALAFFGESEPMPRSSVMRAGQLSGSTQREVRGEAAWVGVHQREGDGRNVSGIANQELVFVSASHWPLDERSAARMTFKHESAAHERPSGHASPTSHSGTKMWML